MKRCDRWESVSDPQSANAGIVEHSAVDHRDRPRTEVHAPTKSRASLSRSTRQRAATARVSAECFIAGQGRVDDGNRSAIDRKSSSYSASSRSPSARAAAAVPPVCDVTRKCTAYDREIASDREDARPSAGSPGGSEMDSITIATPRLVRPKNAVNEACFSIQEEQSSAKTRTPAATAV